MSNYGGNAMEKMESIIEICLELQRGQVGREKKRYKKGIIDKKRCVEYIETHK